MAQNTLIDPDKQIPKPCHPQLSTAARIHQEPIIAHWEKINFSQCGTKKWGQTD